MSTGIQWTDETWNPIAAFDKATGKRGWYCAHVSPGCVNCYAETMNTWRGNGHLYRVPNAPKVDIRIVEKVLLQPLSWRTPRRVFVCSMTDLFLDEHTDEMIDRVFAVMVIAQRHTFQVLTKRPERMRAYLSSPHRRALIDVALANHFAAPLNRISVEDFSNDWPLLNVHAGVSVENQAAWNTRMPELAETPAAVRFLSCEPLLGPLDLCLDIYGNAIHWVIVGGESGANARPMNVEWARSIVAQCRAAGVAPFVKQLGRFPVERTDGVVTWPEIELRDRHGGDMAEWPDDLRVREFPEAVSV